MEKGCHSKGDTEGTESQQNWPGKKPLLQRERETRERETGREKWTVLVCVFGICVYLVYVCVCLSVCVRLCVYICVCVCVCMSVYVPILCCQYQSTHLGKDDPASVT